MFKNTNIGRRGEDSACSFLIENGFDIILRNYHFKHFEIDIIAKKDCCLHFCEVKSRKNNAYGYPETFVSHKQQEHIKTAADNFVYESGWRGKIKFDIISIENNDNKKITFFEDAFF